MKNFIRSLTYLKPYRLRVGVALVCVLIIASLWGGGLGILLPAMKVLFSDEGLHGWAWNMMAQDRMGVQIAQQRTPPGTKLAMPDGRPVELESVLYLTNVTKDKAAAQAGIVSGQWLVGLDDGRPEHLKMRCEELAEALAAVEEGQTVRLRACFPSRPGEATSAATYDVTMSSATWSSRGLYLVVSRIPVPRVMADRFNVFVLILAIGLGVTLLRGAFTFLQEYLIGTAVWQGIMDLRCENYNVVLHLPTTFFSEKGVTDASSRFIQDTSELASGQDTLLGKTLVEPAKAIASVILALCLSWQLTLLAMLGGPPAFYMIRTFGKRMHKASRRALESWSSMLAVLEETLFGIRVVKAYTMEGTERRRFFRVNRQLLKQQFRMALLDAAGGPTVEALGITAGLTAAGLAGYLVFHGTDLFGEVYKMNKEDFVAWMIALFAIFDPVRKLAKVSLRFQRAEAAAARVFDLHDMPLETAAHNPPTLPRHHESIEFRDVSYHYPASTSDVLKNVSLKVQSGQTVAIVGPNGSGKTTLVSLLPRLLDATGGSIIIDGQDTAGVSLRSLRRQIGLVTQDTILFNATIKENIAYGLRRPSEKAVLQAARRAFVDEFVTDRDRFPQGYDTMVGEHGATLSGGQRQRISIARAILRDPAILIFDEATSQVDADSEQRIHEAVKEFVRGRTAFMIAHRFATLMAADIVVVMDDGRIVDHGSHDQLLQRCELYRSLYHTQFGDTNGQAGG